jgi:hypothetical protein
MFPAIDRWAIKKVPGGWFSVKTISKLQSALLRSKNTTIKVVETLSEEMRR